MSTERSLAILGLGWLGEPLGHTLLEQGWRVSGTSRDAGKAARLTAAGIHTQVWDFDAPLPLHWPERLRAHTLLLCVPPGKLIDYPDILGRLARLAVAGGVQRVIFTSATSVYAGVGVKTEADAAPDGPRGARMLAAERAVQACGAGRVLILRLSGLVGGNREPGRFLSGKRFDGGDEPVNLVALEDLLRMIPAILGRNDWPAVLNISAPHHPSRCDFYSEAARLQGLPPPEFGGGGAGKIIDGSALCRWLNMDYAVTDWFDWLAARRPER
ncbi:NAD dependent epimerase/dehydratase family protein [Oceanimonas sp. GK1]|uniref:NAD dependent epimerase/dehydratase n=1 Tax=Oceanimonas sp. (strain GK1 / IBRC-M 10197) TaxID=511062 RepID=UPI0002495582|nr:NAD dependent epimerase/dehydratase [Oceanimonas sp. GK1]AEY01107.1 NAD dependent epimerase/dehydratase family protein [Oceanimonas sp. GK1]